MYKSRRVLATFLGLWAIVGSTPAIADNPFKKFGRWVRKTGRDIDPTVHGFGNGVPIRIDPTARTDSHTLAPPPTVQDVPAMNPSPAFSTFRFVVHNQAGKPVRLWVRYLNLADQWTTSGPFNFGDGYRVPVDQISTRNRYIYLLGLGYDDTGWFDTNSDYHEEVHGKVYGFLKCDMGPQCREWTWTFRP